MKLLERKQQELQRVSTEIQILSRGNPQQQRKCARLLYISWQKISNFRLDELKKQIETIGGDTGSAKKKRKKLEKEYEEVREKVGKGEEMKESEGANDSTLSIQTDENIYLGEQQPEVKPIHKDQFGVYEQIRATDGVEERMLKRKKIVSESEDVFTLRIASLRGIEKDIGNMIERIASPAIIKFEEELRLIRKRSIKDIRLLKIEIAKLEKRLNEINYNCRTCESSMAKMNLTTKRMLFDLIGFVVYILRNALYLVARIRDLLVSQNEN
ncbi:unnamed protein product [Thelazia callipaeda]|uniref:Uncharacterized protein n=1 Tax=Thelazia callipaeda TaxID=103827 RepID=A0A158RD22_THECL|nr:unnamed protein product [Thelazia callipaeda]